MPAIDRPAGFGVLQSFKRQVSPLAERQVVAVYRPRAERKAVRHEATLSNALGAIRERRYFLA